MRSGDRVVQLLVAGALGVATILALSWFFNNFELATREESTGFSREARRNPLLAAERFLRKLGGEAQSIASTEVWRKLPEGGDALVIYRYSPPAGEQRRRELRAWIEAGGHLIVEADSSLSSDADADTDAGARKGVPNLLAELGVRRHHRKPGEDEEGLTEIEIHFSDTEETVVVALSSYYYLEDTSGEASAAVPLGEGYGLLQYEVGEGLVTVLSDNQFLSNWHIDDHDHALALALLVGVQNGASAWLVHDVEMPSLLDLGWQHLPHGLGAAAGALLLWLWYLGRRLGPTLPPAEAPRRDIGEHLAATAGYLWRLDQAQALYRRNRDQIEQAWLHKHYVLRKLTAPERYAWMAARAGLSARAVERALHGDFAGEADFVEMTACLQVLRNNL